MIDTKRQDIRLHSKVGASFKTIIAIAVILVGFFSLRATLGFGINNPSPRSAQPWHTTPPQETWSYLAVTGANGQPLSDTWLSERF